MPTGPEAFLELPDACWLRPCDRTNLKTALCHIRTLVGRRINTARLRKRPKVSGCNPMVKVFFSGCWLFRFYGVSTFVGYSTPNSVFMYIHSTKDFWTNTKKVKFSMGRISFVCTWLTSFNSSYFFVKHCLSQEGQNVIYFDVFGQIG